ncbi:hypothetical protein Tco_1328029 [Tanacetum coccineum]
MLYPSRRYGVSVPALTKDHKRLKINTPYPEDSIFRIQLNTAYPIPLNTAYPVVCPIQRIHPNRLIRLRMTKVIKGEFEKIKDVKVEDVSLTCDTSLEIFNMEVNRLSGMDNDLFTYKVEVANIPCNSVMDDDLEDETNDDMDKEKKSTMKGFETNGQADYYLGITSITVNGKNAYELKGKILDDLHKNAFSGTNGEDAVEHIKFFLKIVDLIDLPNVNQDKLRVVIFLISLVGDAWRWFDGIRGSITSWVDLTDKFFRKYYPPSRTSKV